jgi:hypothetical protein
MLPLRSVVPFLAMNNFYRRVSLNSVNFDSSVTESDGQRKKQSLTLQRRKRFLSEALVDVETSFIGHIFSGI